jgi:hypothetical protein
LEAAIEKEMRTVSEDGGKFPSVALEFGLQPV